MKVFYDITTLGLGFYDRKSRTGVFRYTEGLAYGLLNSQECELLFCTSGTSRHLYMARDYLSSDSELQKVALPCKKKMYKELLFRLRQRLSTAIEHTSPAGQLPLKVLRKGVGYLDKITERFYENTAFEFMREADIYHSPFQPIPEKVSRTKRTKAFLTIYDLIPILYPKFFDFYPIENLKQTIAGLNSDSWVLCPSRSTQIDLCNYSKTIDPAKVIVTHLAASELFQICMNPKRQDEVRRKYGIPDAPYILSLSTLEPRKNIAHAIRCFVNLVRQEKIQDLYFVLVGAKGWNYDTIFSEISSDPRLKDRIIVTGFVPDEYLAPLYSGAMAFVYPSFYEGFGLPPLEAMQCGVPVITSDTSSLPEVVGDAGIVLNPMDADGLCQSILELYGQPSLRQSMSRKSLAQAKKFSWEKCTQQTINAYKSALD